LKVEGGSGALLRWLQPAPPFPPPRLTPKSYGERFSVKGLGFRNQSLRFKVQGSRLGGYNLGLSAWGLGLGGWDLDLRGQLERSLIAGRQFALML
jgi:hypothetical protein